MTPPIPTIPSGLKAPTRPLPPEWGDLASLLRRRVPFLTEALSVLPLVVNDTLEYPVQTDGKAIQVSPDLYDAMSEFRRAEGLPWFPTDNAGRAYYILRSCLHTVLRYDQRRGWRGKKVWAEAVDNVVNQMLRDLFLMEPFDYKNHPEKRRAMEAFMDSTGRYDSRFFQKSVEETYEILQAERDAEQPNQPEPPPEGTKGNNPDKPEGDGPSNKQPGEGEDDDAPPDDEEEKEGKDQGEKDDKPEGDDEDQDQDQDGEGEGSGDDDDEGEDGDPGDGDEGEPQDGDGQPQPGQGDPCGDDFGADVPDSGIPSDLGELVDNNCKDYLERHGEALAGLGNAFSREVKAAKEKPPILLSQVLKKIRDVLPGMVWSYRRPSRSELSSKLQQGKAMRMPSASQNPGDLVRELVVIIDLSSSMDEREIRTAIQIFFEAFKFTGKGRKIRLIGFTTEVVFDVEFTEHTAETVKFNHAGGTNIYCSLQHILDQKIRPSAVILVTDGECSTLPQIAKWSLLPRLRTILVRATPWTLDNFPGIVFKADVVR